MQVNKPVNKPSKDLQFLIAVPILKFNKKMGCRIRFSGSDANFTKDYFDKISNATPPVLRPELPYGPRPTGVSPEPLPTTLYL